MSGAIKSVGLYASRLKTEGSVPHATTLCIENI